MKTFKIKDLVVSVGDNLDPHNLCAGNTLACPAHTGIACPAHTGIGCVAHTGCFGHTPFCVGFTCHGISFNCHGCTFVVSICPVHSINPCTGGTIITCGGTIVTCGGTIVATGGIHTKQFEHLNVDEIESLKGELTNLQNEMATRMQPQSKEDLDTLETKLNEALAEIKVQKGKIK
jgi:hypothetical protein